MKNLRLILLAMCVLGVSAWGQEEVPEIPGVSTKGYALPSGYKGVAQVGKNPDSIGITESGDKTPESRGFTCGWPPAEYEQDSVTYTVGHYFDKAEFDRQVKSKLEGEKAFPQIAWKATVERNFKALGGEDGHAQGLLKKGGFSLQEVSGLQAASWETTFVCSGGIADEGDTGGRLDNVYTIHGLVDQTFVDITATVHGPAGQAKSLAYETLENIKKLDYKSIH